MCGALPGSGLNSGHHGDRKRRRRKERKWKEREISAASAQPHSDGWSLEPAILNPLEGHFFTFPYKSPDKLFTSCSSTQHDICEQAFVCLLRPAFDKPHCTDLQYAPICDEWPLQTTLYIIALLVFEVFLTAKLVSAKNSYFFYTVKLWCLGFGKNTSESYVVARVLLVVVAMWLLGCC